LGAEIKESKIITPRRIWRWSRFILIKWNYEKPLATDDGFLCFIPKVNLNDIQVKALLAYLNSSFNQYYIETEGIKAGGGAGGIDIAQAERMPVLDTRKLSDEEVRKLANLFDKLEAKAGEIGGATEREQIEQLKPIIHEIDREIGKILELPDLEVYAIQNAVDQLVKRRIAGAGEVRRHAIRGEEEIPELEEFNELENRPQTTLDSF